MSNVGQPIPGCTLLLGAYFRSSPPYFDDVVFDGTNPPVSFDTGLEETFPTSMLNSGGSSGGINRTILIGLASVPDLGQPLRASKRTGINGQPLYLRLRSAPHDLICDVELGDIDFTDTLYARTWDYLKDLAYRKVYVWFLFKGWAARGFIDSLPDVFWGEKRRDVEPMVLAFSHFYKVSISGSTKTYTLLR